MNEKQIIQKNSMYPPGEQPADRMQINELGIIETDVSNGEDGVNTALAPTLPLPTSVVPKMQTTPPISKVGTTVPVANFNPKEVAAKPVVVNSQTYFEDSSNGNGIEIDLVSFREKGEETRFLSFVIKNHVENDEYQLQTTMDSEERFIHFKQFVSNLNWND